MRSGAALSVLMSVILGGAVAVPPAAAAPKPFAVPLFIPANASGGGWTDKWGDIPSGAAVQVAGDKMKVTGTLTNQSYGCVYRALEIDLDKTPFLEINVESVSHHWYLILRGSQLPNGWVKVQADTDQTGTFLYDLRLTTGLTGRQTFGEFQIGVSTEGSASGNKGQSLVLNSLRIVSASSGGDSLELYGPHNRKLSGWKNVNDDKSPSGVDIVPGEQSGSIRGNRPGQSYGMMYKAVSLDFSKFSVLKVEVESVTHHWYLIVTHPSLNKGFARIQPDTNLTGAFYYDLKDITGLQGVQDVRLQVGISTNEQSPNAFGETMTFKEIAFLAPSQVPASAKLLEKKDLRFQQKIQAAESRAVKVLQEPSPLVTRPDKASPGTSFRPVPIVAAAVDVLRSLGESFAASFAPRPAPQGKSPIFRDTGKALEIDNGLYRVSFSKDNGSFLSLQAAGASAPLILGAADGCLWKADTQDRAVVESGAFAPKSPDHLFAWVWDAAKKRLTFDYDNRSVRSLVRVIFEFDASNSIKMWANLDNRSEKTFMSFSLPQGLLFATEDLDRVILPRQVGVAFLPGFFRAGRQWSDPYPAAFADFAWVGSRAGAFAVYGVQPAGIFQPTTLEIGGAADGRQGYYNHRLASFVEPGRKWETPVVRLAVGRSADQTIREYARDNGIDQFPSLEKKLGPELTHRLNRSVFLKMDQSANIDLPSAIRFIDELPANALLHLAAFWPGGFDKNYPDYLPPDPQYGTLADFKRLVAKAQARGMLVMPYTNPTWWNEGPTLKKLGADRIALRELDGTLRSEKYNGNPGIVVDPLNAQVIERNGQTVREFTKEASMNLLFQDQLGARRWLYRAKTDKPLAYVEGLLQQAARESAKIPLMTEGGFDRLIPHEAGFCGMTSMSFPGYKEYDDLWGAGNWEIDPISLYLAHDKVNFYQHNLSDDVLSDTPGKVAWNVVHGFGLNAAHTYIRQNPEKEWISLAAGLHEHLLSRVLGQPLIGYRRLGPSLIWSRFGDVDIFANLSLTSPLVLGDDAVAPEGFAARSRDGDLLVGRFARLNGAEVEGAPYIIIKTKAREIEVLQAGYDKTTFLTLVRPSAWTSDGSVHAYRDNGGPLSPVPVAVEGDRLTFLYRADDKPARYLVRYEPADGDPVSLSVEPEKGSLSGPGLLRVEVALKNAGTAALTGATVNLSAWVVRTDSALPFLEEAAAKGKKKEAPKRASVGTTLVLPKAALQTTQAARFQLDVPAESFLDGEYIWLRAEVEYQAGGRRRICVLDRKVDLGK